MRRLNPTHILLLSFLGAIIVGTLLLSLPIATSPVVGEASSDGTTSFVDALFTATSAVCVTGLTVKDTGTHFSLFGQIVIIALIQAGGLGILTFSTAFAVMLGRRLTIKDNLVIQSALDSQKLTGLKALIKYILLLTISIESLGALILACHWMNLKDANFSSVIYRSIFHAVSAFCNAGFSLFSDSLGAFRNDMVVNLVITGLIILGGLGFFVLLDIPHLRFWRSDRWNRLARLSLQTKMVLLITFVLIFVGAISILALENHKVLEGLSLREKLLASYFQSVTARTAGFNTLRIGLLSNATLFLLVVLMFIGASPGSTGGGIKTITLGVLIATFRAMLKGKGEVVIFGKTIPRVAVRKAVIIFLLSLTLVALATFAMCIFEQDKPFLPILFEVVSAFGTVGLSCGLTASVSSISKLLLALTMFIGRVGPLTIALAIRLSEEGPVYKFPEERIMVG